MVEQDYIFMALLMMVLLFMTYCGGRHHLHH
jgi:hypothetical protein